MDRIKEILNKCGVSVYRLTYTLTEAAELYLIKKQLDMPRFKKIGIIKAEIFRDFEEDGKKYRGSALIYLERGLTDEEMEQKIKNAYFAASFVKNPFYDLPSPSVSDLVPSSSD
ncbi:MAG: TldD/PmbA family protein, partial [Lachnospiraceae bacterium]|nr:TldD/PmbA family protein [Lachnospiraceae bacterium]